MKVQNLDKKTRLMRTFQLETPDRPPILGGWLAAPEYIQALTGCSEDDYWTDPFRWGIEAEHILGSDGVIGIFTPIHRGEFRCVDGQVIERRAAYTIDAVLDEIASYPEPEDEESAFDEEAAYTAYATELRQRQVQCGDILWCPADWSVIPKALWYHEFGHEAALSTLALYPDRYRKLIRLAAVRGRQRATLIARAAQEGLHPGVFLTGEDICSQQGPMVSPKFLRREYFPWLAYTFEPLLAAGVKIIWHCDGDYRVLLDDILACGVAGLQGFQRECGMELEWIVKRRARNGDPLIIFGPMSVTETLPFGSPADVRAEVQRAMSLCRDKAGQLEAALVFFTSNTITPDIPLENVRVYWQTVLDSAW
ncbi:MAG: hypothetical protein JXA33_21700 [Anaerolineae bacterium]|nr:hypothetical protein [Anaerolineae bacterium]